MKTLQLSIPDIHCASCEKLIKASLADVKGVSSVKVKIETKEVSINYNDKLISKKNIISAIQEMTGYLSQEIS
jgi:copper chaperone CopZ